jgi:A/G-specific adenine glycosylase
MIRDKTPACAPPTRLHTINYHRALLLDDQDGRSALLSWFDSVSTSRSMPWRKPWIDPSTIPDPDALRSALERRAYEVWISEIMLQQTRVATVIDYWNRWMAKWPTIQDLAAATPDDVLSAWRGLGYYSRATRIHEAAKLVVKDGEMKGLLPADASQLEAKVPGVGRYTAGAISAIVFGRAEAMVDGNVIRVLSRQLGLYADFKTSKAPTDVVWAAADALVKAVASDGPLGAEEMRGSDRPGRWGQALMELGSTVCTPKPNCSACPINSTCRAYGEGKLAAEDAGHDTVKLDSSVLDIEDMCTLCDLMEEPEVEPTKKTNAKAKKEAPISQCFTKKKTASPSATTELVPEQMTVVVNHAARFPAKGVKKAVRVEQNIVLAIRRHDGRYLIQKRPEKGLLANLWELPSVSIAEANAHSATFTAKSEKNLAILHASVILGSNLSDKVLPLKHVRALGAVPWLFSHIRLTMHLHLFTLDEGHDDLLPADPQSRWETAEKIDEESMGTGMRKCWALVKEAEMDCS